MRRRPVLEWASRIGYVARGVVYLSIGAIALMAALDKTPRAAGALGSMEAWADWPAGKLLLLLVAWGLLAFAVWCGLLAIFDADGKGDRPKGLALRAGDAVTGVIHAGLAYSAFKLADGLHHVSEEGKARQAAAKVLDFPLGHWVLVLVGLGVLVFGLTNIVQAFRMDVGKRLNCPGEVRPWVNRLGRLGTFGQGVAFVPLGWMLARAGWSERASEARSMGGALQVLERQPFGSWVLAVTALGLMAYGLFALAEARYRRINVPRLAS